MGERERERKREKEMLEETGGRDSGHGFLYARSLKKKSQRGGKRSKRE